MNHKFVGCRAGTARKAGVSTFAALVIAASAHPAMAQDIPEEETTDLGTLGGAQSGAFFTDADGSTVMGYAEGGDGTVRLVLWENGAIRDITPEGAQFFSSAFERSGSRNFIMSGNGEAVTGYFARSGSLGQGVIIRNGIVTQLTGADFLFPRVISHDGLVVAGRGGFIDGRQKSFYYDAAGLHWLPDLGRSNLNGSASVDAINADGSVMVGTDGTGPQRAVRWVNGQIQDLGVLPNGNVSFANDVSADGNVVVGYSQVELAQGFRQPEAFIWRDGQMTGLGFLNNTDEPGNNQSEATAVSGDGTTVIGRSRWRNDAGFVFSQGFVWRDGVMQNIGVIPTTSTVGQFATVSAISHDGRAIAGQARSVDHLFEAFIWRDGEITLLGTLGGAESYSTDISADGSTVVGVARNESGAQRAFIWRTVMQDFTNMLASFVGIAEETETALINPRERMRRIEEPSCDSAGKILCVGAGLYGWRSGSGISGSNPKETGAILSVGLRPHRLVQFGMTLVLGDSSSDLGRIEIDSSRALSGWLQLADPQRRGGPVLEAWYTRSHDRLKIERSAGLDDVQQALGSAKLRGESFGARASYRLPFTDSWMLSPTVSLARITFRRGAFVENACDFPVSYDTLSLQETRGGLGAKLSGSAGSGVLSLAAEVEHDLDRSRGNVTGRSEIPGAESLMLSSDLARHSTVGRFNTRFAYPLGSASLRVNFDLTTPHYKDHWEFGGAVQLNISF